MSQDPEKVVAGSKLAEAPNDRMTAAPPAAGVIGKIERIALREVWRHEAYNLTAWLEENIDVLNDVLDINLTNVEREQSAGSFSVDLVAERSRVAPSWSRTSSRGPTTTTSAS